MKKIKKKVLWITDNWDEEDQESQKEDFLAGEFFYNSKANIFSFELEFMNELKYPSGKYDAILIDYGLYDNTEKNYRVLKRILKKGCLVFWGSAFNREIIEQDLKKIRPELTCIRFVGIRTDDILYTLYCFLRKKLRITCKTAEGR